MSKQNLEPILAALDRMTATQLRTKYHEVFGEPVNTGNKGFLVKRIAWRIQALAEGGLSERARRRAEELARDADIPPTDTLGFRWSAVNNLFVTSGDLAADEWRASRAADEVGTLPPDGL